MAHSYKEVHYFHPLAYAVILGVTAVSLFVPLMPTAVRLLTLLLVLAALLLCLRYELTVDTAELRTRFGFVSFFGTRLVLEELAAMEQVRYNGIMDFGGWGMKRGVSRRFKGVRARTARGETGLLLTMRDGARYLIGTQQVGPLESALRRARPDL